MNTTTATAPPEPIDAAFPPDVGAGGLSRFAAYQRFPAFTWPWFLRRAMVFWPLAAAWGIFLAVWHASSMETWEDAFPLALRGVVAGIVIVSIGPAFASALRYLRLPRKLELLGVCSAIVVGLLIATVAGNWVSDYHSMLMSQHHGRGMHTPETVQSMSRVLGNLMGKLPDLLGLLLIGGGLELISYVTERRRLADHQRRHDLVVLRRDKADSDMKLAVLQAQIEPHFLFNTLASVHSLVLDEPRRAMATIDALSEYLRSTLVTLRRDVGATNGTLGEQVDICVRYLDLMNIRTGGRITVELDVGGELRWMAFPPLLLISLVENAVKHGVERRAGPASVAIRAQLVSSSTGERLQVDVEDDGAGLAEGAGSGVGLANVRAQLRHRFGNDAALSVANLPARGVRSRITLPAMRT